MAAGITHELNQPLAALRGFSDNTRVLLERGDQASARENLEAIAALTERMGKITNQLKLFVGRRGRVARGRRSWRVRCATCSRCLQKRLQDVAVDIAWREGGAVARVRRGWRRIAEFVANCDDLRLEQVLINLLGNALDARRRRAIPRASPIDDRRRTKRSSRCRARQRAGHSGRRPAAPVRAVLHDQGNGPGTGAGPRDFVVDRARLLAARWSPAMRRTAARCSC